MWTAVQYFSASPEKNSRLEKSFFLKSCQSLEGILTNFIRGKAKSLSTLSPFSFFTFQLCVTVPKNNGRKEKTRYLYSRKRDKKIEESRKLT